LLGPLLVAPKNKVSGSNLGHTQTLEQDSILSSGSIVNAIWNLELCFEMAQVWLISYNCWVPLVFAPKIKVSGSNLGHTRGLGEDSTVSGGSMANAFSIVDLSF
jgi:hypothetical protein